MCTVFFAPGRWKKSAILSGRSPAAPKGPGLHVFSTGRNWGLGSREPARDGAVSLDLSQLASVREFDLQGLGRGRARRHSAPARLAAGRQRPDAQRDGVLRAHKRARQHRGPRGRTASPAHTRPRRARGRPARRRIDPGRLVAARIGSHSCQSQRTGSQPFGSVHPVRSGGGDRCRRPSASTTRGPAHPEGIDSAPTPQ